MITAGRKILLQGLAWNGLDQVARLGITRLIFFPIALRLLGPASFGDFVIALSICAVIGGAVSSAFSNHLIQQANRISTDERESVLKIATAHTLLVTTVLMALAFAVVVPLATSIGGVDLEFWLLAFMAHYIILNPTETMMVKYRIERDFRRMALIHAGGVAALLIALVLFPLIGRSAIVFSLLLWAAAPALYVLAKEGGVGIRVSLPVLKASGHSLRDYAVGGFVQLSTGYLDRLMLAFWWPPEQVTIFFAAVSLALLFQSPATMLATFILSLLARVDSSRLTSRALLSYLLAACVGGLMVYLIGMGFGDWLLRTLYPDQYSESIKVMGFAIGASALMTVSTLIRPFVVKFRPSHWIPRLAILTLVIRILLTWMLVRSGGYEGAALALLYGSLFTTLAWIAVYLSMLTADRLAQHSVGRSDSAE